MRTLAYASFAALTLALAACSSTENHDAGFIRQPYGGTCVNDTQCRIGLVCQPGSRMCLPPGNVMRDHACILTGDCSPGLYCAPVPSSDGMSPTSCQPAGDTPLGGTCTSTGSCVAGAVCFHAAPGLYGVCELPRGTMLPDGVDGGMAIGDAGTAMAGTAHDLNRGPCNDDLDCLAGLVCNTSTHTCLQNAPGATGVTPWQGETCVDTPPPGDAGVRAYFEIPAADGTPTHDFFRLPFPNDIRRDPTTGHINLHGFPHPGNGALGFDIVQRYVDASESELDGFGTNQQVYFRFSDNIDFGTLGIGATVFLIDLTTGMPTNSVAYGANTGRNQYICNNYFTVETGSGAPMVPGHTYAAYLTTGIHDAHHAPIVRDPDLIEMLAATAPADPVHARAYAAYAPFRAYLSAQHIDASTILNAAVFTTQHPTDIVPALRTAVRAQPPPAATGFVRCDTGVHSPCDDGLTGADHVRGCFAADPNFDELQGTIDVPIFQHGTRPYNTLGEGDIQLDAMGHPIVQGTEPVCVSITVPHGATMPAGGWPVVIYAHGTGGNYRSAVTEGLATALSNIDLGGGTQVHFAVLGYDGVMHGTRRGAGVTDPPDVLFFNFANPHAARDNILQGAADVFAFVRAAETVHLMDLPMAGGSVQFDPSHIMFLGQSQGSTVGVPAAPFEPNLAAMVFSGAGGDLRVSLTTKRHPVDIASLTPLVLQDPAGGPPALNMFQAYFERSDAVNYGPLLLSNQPMGIPLRPMVQTYGLGDTFSTEGTMRALAGATGLPVAAPIAHMGQPDQWPAGMGVPLPIMNNIVTANGMTTAALLEADPMGAYDGHFVLFNDPTLKNHVMVFLATAAMGMPVVR